MPPFFPGPNRLFDVMMVPDSKAEHYFGAEGIFLYHGPAVAWRPGHTRALDGTKEFVLSNILFCGDPHGRFEQINRAARERRPDAMILLGDCDLSRPLELEIAEALEHTEVWWIPGNHDYDKEENYDFLFGSALADRNLDGRVTVVAGARIAGLGGIFQGAIWHPHDKDGAPRYRTREAYLATQGRRNRWRDGLPRKRRGAIWWEDYEALFEQQADVLVTHEAPGCHPLGFAELDDLARAMGVHTIVHGHHHTGYTIHYRRGDLTVHGVGLAGVSTLAGERIIPGRYDDRATPALERRRANAARILTDLIP